MASSSYPGKSILVVEDDSITREALAMVLRAAGCQVVVASNGQEALQVLRTGPLPDLILLDLVMPVVDGIEFRRQQMQDAALAAIPVVIVSGAADLKRQVTALGAAGAVLKPVEFERLPDTIRPFLGRQDTNDVLVVDDEPSVRKLLELALSAHGYTVWTAASGAEAVEIFRRLGGTIGLVLLDVQMPGLDGPWTLAALRRLDPAVQCCFMSGNIGAYDAETLLAMGAHQIIQKPFGLAEVTRAVRHLLSQAPAKE